MSIPSITLPVVEALLGNFRNASLNDLSATPNEVITLIDLFAVLWPVARPLVEAKGTSKIDEIVTALQPAGRASYSDAMSAVTAMRSEMVALADVPQAQWHNRKIAAHGLSVLRVIHLLGDAHMEPAKFDTLVASFLPALAPMLTAPRTSTKE